MDENKDLQQRLIQRIQARRVKIHAFGRGLERRGKRLMNLSIVCTAITAVFTAGPALGGLDFATYIQQVLGLETAANVWQPICLLAVILSAVAAGANNLYKSNEIASRLAKAESCSALLDGLQTALEFGQLSLPEATKQYQQYISAVPFIPEEVSKPVVANG